MPEVWNEIKEFTGGYQISTFGNVRSVTRVVLKSDGKSVTIKGKSIIPQINSWGYLFVVLYKNGKGTTCCVHKLVLNTFIPNPENKPQGNHINGIKTDNCTENLEWVSVSENIKHAFQTGLANPNIMMGKDNVTSKKVINKISGEIYDCVREAADIIGMKRRTLSAQLNGQNPNYTNLMYL